MMISGPKTLINENHKISLFAFRTTIWVLHCKIYRVYSMVLYRYFINIDNLCQVTVGSMHHSLTLSRVNHFQNPPENQEIRHQKTIMENVLTRYLRCEQNLCFSWIQAKFGWIWDKIVVSQLLAAHRFFTFIRVQISNDVFWKNSAILVLEI